MQVIEFLENLSDKIADLFEEKRWLVVTILGVLVTVIILMIVLSAVQCSSGRKTEVKETFETTDSFLFPENITLVDDYYFSRESKEKWTDEETDEWFTEITDSQIKELSDSNDTKINDLLGTAP